MEEEEIQMAFVEGMVRTVISQIEEITCGVFTVEFEIKKVLVGGKNA